MTRYKASDGKIYGLDFRNDTHVALGFGDGAEIVRRPGTQAQIMNIIWLLNSKAKMYQYGSSSQTEQIKHGADIIFILDYMLSHRMRIDTRRQRARWVVGERFWNDFTAAHVGAQEKLIGVGLRIRPARLITASVASPIGGRRTSFGEHNAVAITAGNRPGVRR